MISVEGDFGVRLPKMVVDPPGPESRRMAEILRSHENPGLTNIMDGDIPLAWRRARGTNVQDADGNIYIDFTSGWGAAVAGHAHPKIVEAMKAQLDELVYAPGGYSSNRPRAELSRRLAELTWGRLGKSHLLNSGAEANELALKIARLYKKSSRFVAFEGAYHGMQTAGSLSVTGIKEYKRNLPTALPVVHTPFAYCYRCPVGETYPECDVACLKYTEHMLTDPGSWLDDVAGVIVEPIQGRSGWIVPPKEFMTRLERLCHQNGIPLIYDEVLTGFGRTGRMFCHEHFGASPDIVTCGKGLSSGFPISAVLASGKMMDSVQPGTHLSTYSADPVGCAAALASIQVIQEEGLVERAARLGERF